MTRRREAGIFYREQASPDKKRESRPEKPTGAPREESSVESYDGLTSWVTPMTGAPYVQQTSPDRPPAQGLVISPTTNNPGSAKVIPSGRGFENKKSSRVAKAHMQKIAATIQAILAKTDKAIHDKAAAVVVQSSTAQETEGTWKFQVGGQRESYDVLLRVEPFGASCTCNFWAWQGPAYWASKKDYALGTPATQKPDTRDPEGKHLLCKHVVKCAQEILGL